MARDFSKAVGPASGSCRRPVRSSERMTRDLLSAGPLPPPRPAPNELWHHSLYWLEDSINVSLPHELDVRRMTKVLKGLWLVGERPIYEELKCYLRQLWPAFPSTQRQVRELWRTLERNPHHRFRRIAHHDEPLYIIDLVCEKHQLLPPEARIRAVAVSALKAVQDTAVTPDPARYATARADLAATLAAIEQLRRLRHGARALGLWFNEDDPLRGGPKRPRWW